MAKRDVRQQVLDIYKRHYGTDDSDDQALATDVNAFDKDPAAFYEDICDAFPDADLEDLLFNGGTVAQVIAAIVRPIESPQVFDWIDLYFADLYARAKRAKPTRDQCIYTILNFVHRHGAQGRRGLLKQVTAIQGQANVDVASYVELAKAQKLSFTEDQMSQLLEEIATFAVEYPPPYPPL